MVNARNRQSKMDLEGAICSVSYERLPCIVTPVLCPLKAPKMLNTHHDAMAEMHHCCLFQAEHSKATSWEMMNEGMTKPFQAESNQCHKSRSRLKGGEVGVSTLKCISTVSCNPADRKRVCMAHARQATWQPILCIGGKRNWPSRTPCKSHKGCPNWCEKLARDPLILRWVSER